MLVIVSGYPLWSQQRYLPRGCRFVVRRRNSAFHIADAAGMTSHSTTPTTPILDFFLARSTAETTLMEASPRLERQRITTESLFPFLFLSPLTVLSLRPYDSRPRLTPDDDERRPHKQRCYTLLPRLAAADVNHPTSAHDKKILLVLIWTDFFLCLMDVASQSAMIRLPLLLKVEGSLELGHEAYDYGCT